MSAYGLARTTRVVDLNRWLSDRGWLVWREPPAPVTLAALADSALWSDTVDWTRTRARAMGAGHVYIHRRGRGPEGGIEPGSEYDRLVADIREGLATVTDPLSGYHVVARVRTADEAYTGGHLADAPDLIVTWAPGYRGSLESTLGGAASAVVAPNSERWVADHAALAEDLVPGVWISSRPLNASTISVLDVAPTVLQFFGQPVPPAIEGRPQLRDMPSNTSRR